MAQIETLGILQDIECLISDQLQLVSYKWLSRNYSVSSNVAKRLLEEFVEKHANGIEVIYTLSGWLKCDPSSYHIRLVSGPKVTEAKQDFEGSCSIQVYSVQASIPKDPAILWNVEFVQAEELFKQPSIVDNCLRDNRFCAISNSFVKRKVEETSSSSAPQLKSLGQGTSKSDLPRQTITAPPQLQNQGQHSNLRVGSICCNVGDVKSESNCIEHAPASKASADKENAPSKPANKKKVQNDKGSSSTEGSLANLWGRASAKTKPISPAQNSNAVANSIGVSAEAQINAREAVENESSDDGGQDLNFKRASNGEGTRKRRMILDFSDEDDFEDAVNLGSPDIPTKKSIRDLNERAIVLTSEKSNLNFEELEEQKPKVKEDMQNDRGSNHQQKEDTSIVSNNRTAGLPSIEKQHSCPENEAQKNNKQTKANPGSPNRRKVLEKRIDEHGREVTEVVWEGEETVPRSLENGTTMIADSSAVTSTVNNNRTAGLPSMEKTHSCPENDVKKNNKQTKANPGSPKRRKVLKTRIDERGREVTEVVWEGEETVPRNIDNGTTKKADSSTATSTVNRPPATKKSPAAGNNTAPSNAVGKGGNKKTGNKDPKQGNILSFFKRV